MHLLDLSDITVLEHMHNTCEIFLTSLLTLDETEYSTRTRDGFDKALDIILLCWILYGIQSVQFPVGSDVVNSI